MPHLLEVLLSGIKLFVRNLKIVIPPIILSFMIYLFLAVGLASVIPQEKLVELEELAEKGEEQIIKEMYNIVMLNPVKFFIAFIIFGSIAFVSMIFIVAGMVGASLKIARFGTFTFNEFFYFGYIYTPRMLALELLISVAILAASLPFLFLTGVMSSVVPVLISAAAIIVVAAITFPSRFILIALDTGVFDALAASIRFSFKKPSSLLVFLLTVVMVGLSSFVPLLQPFAFALTSIWYAILVASSISSAAPSSESSEGQPA
jgi:hypothetical protein